MRGKEGVMGVDLEKKKGRQVELSISSLSLVLFEDQFIIARFIKADKQT